ncbi:MAG: hypothetical protein ABIW79_02350 [Gemmatimonas sp.]
MARDEGSQKDGTRRQQPADADHEKLGGANEGDSSDNGAMSRGSKGGRARSNSYGDSDGDNYGGGGEHGGMDGDKSP